MTLHWQARIQILPVGSWIVVSKCGEDMENSVSYRAALIGEEQGMSSLEAISKQRDSATSDDPISPQSGSEIYPLR